MGDDLVATWKSKIKWYSENNHFKDMNRIDGMPTEFERKICLLEKIESLIRDPQCQPEHFTDRIIFMSTNTDTEWGAKGNERCACNSRGHRSFLGPGSKEKWYGTCNDKPDESWDQTAQNMMANFLDPVIQNFVPPAPLREENYEAKEEKEVNTL